MRPWPFALACLGMALYVAWHLTVTAGERERSAILAAFAQQWQTAVSLGANADRGPQVQFVSYPELGARAPLAQTFCERPHPRIEVNEVLAHQFFWFTKAITAPHEVAHVLVCLDGDVDGWKDSHGEHWEAWVRELVSGQQAEDVIDEQRRQEARGDSLADVD